MAVASVDGLLSQRGRALRASRFSHQAASRSTMSAQIRLNMTEDRYSPSLKCLDRANSARNDRTVRDYKEEHIKEAKDHFHCDLREAASVKGGDCLT
jgi:hypothetical protein